MICDEGLDNVLERHRILASATRSGVAAIGLELFVAPPDPSVPRPAETLRYPPEAPATIPPPVDGPEPTGPIEGPAAGLAQLVAARRDRHLPLRVDE